MLDIKRISINTIDDYNQLLDSGYVPSSHIDSEVVKTLQADLMLKCRSIIIEYPYYESDYLSNYYIFYSKKLRKFPKECCRLLLFSDSSSSDLIGYVSLRPTYEGRKIGRTYLLPKYLIGRNAHLILPTQKIHFQGLEYTLKAFPHMRQESDVSVCAHVALWSVTKSFASRFRQYRDIRLGELVEMVQTDSERRIPSSGLTPSQIASVFNQMGFSAVICRSDNARKKPCCIDQVLPYILSGIPVVGISSQWRHAVAIIGIGERIAPVFKTHTIPTRLTQQLSPSGPKVLLSTKLIDEVCVNDDNFFPYKQINRVLDNREISYRQSNSCIFSDFDYAVIPLYPRIQLLYEDVEDLIMHLAKTNTWNWLSSDTIVVRIFLASANTYREYVNEIDEYKFSLDPMLKSALLTLDMSKFLWCVEISTIDDYIGKNSNGNAIVRAIVLIDTTSATINPAPFLISTGLNKFYYSDDGEWKESILEKPLYIPEFDKNLEYVEAVEVPDRM